MFDQGGDFGGARDLGVPWSRAWSRPLRPYSMVDLFAGCGGLSLGFETVGFEPVFVNELNPHAMDTYRANRFHAPGNEPFATNDELKCHDVAELLEPVEVAAVKARLSSLGTHDLRFPSCGPGSTLDVLAGGPPCQGFSGIGHRRTHNVDREKVPSNHLYAAMAEVIESLRPRIFLFENVRGLRHARWSASGGLVWDSVKKRFLQLENKGYVVRAALVRARDFGVPQNRPRVLIIGIRRDIAEDASDLLDLDPGLAEDDDRGAIRAGFVPDPAKDSVRPPGLANLLGDLEDPAIAGILQEAKRTGCYPPGELKTETYPRPKPEKGVQSWLRGQWYRVPAERVGRLTEQVYSRHSKTVLERFSWILDPDAGELPPELRTKKFRQVALPAEWGKDGPFITATSLPDDYVHYAQPRILTVREWARLQLFPDWYVFKGPRTTGGLRRAGNPREGRFGREVPMYTQVGNAVPVPLAAAIAGRFRLILDRATGGR